MNVPAFDQQDLVPLIPALTLSLGACVLMLSEVFLNSPKRAYQAWIALAACTVGGFLAFFNAFEPARAVFQGFAVLDPFSSLVTAIVCLGGALAVLLSSGFLRHRNAERGEYYALVLFACAGMSLLALSSELITLFVNLEVMSIATYALTAYLRRGSRPSEAGFKYFILGAFAAAVMLYGAALLYGATGTTKLMEMEAPLRAALSTQPALVMLGFLLVGVGFAFKVAAVPFHMWTPDVYEGAPTPVTALMSAGVKAAAFAALVRVFMFVGKAVDPQTPFVFFAGLAALTMVVGNLLAMPQRNVKRMLAYSSVAHAGYLLVGVATLFSPSTQNASMAVLKVSGLVAQAPVTTAEVLKGLLIYLLGYTVTSLGAFGVLSAIERREDEAHQHTWDLERLAGLAQRRPGWAVAMAAFMMSLAGVPLTVGFIGKLYIFRAAVDGGLLGLVIVGVLSSAAGAYYYLRVVVYMFMRTSPEGAQLPERHTSTDFALIACAVGVLVLGMLPGTVSGWLTHAGMLFGAQ